MSRKRKATRGNPARTITLYHYTHEAHLKSILSDEVLRTTESNISFERPHAGPDVVWLTTNPDLLGANSDGLGFMTGESKAQIRITVEVPHRDVHEWRSWARAHNSTETVMENLSKAGGADGWRVIERPIPKSEWREFARLEEVPG